MGDDPLLKNIHEQLETHNADLRDVLAELKKTNSFLETVNGNLINNRDAVTKKLDQLIGGK